MRPGPKDRPFHTKCYYLKGRPREHLPTICLSLLSLRPCHIQQSISERSERFQNKSMPQSKELSVSETQRRQMPT